MHGKSNRLLTAALLLLLCAPVFGQSKQPAQRPGSAQVMGSATHLHTFYDLTKSVWLPDVDPLVLGAGNLTTLTNMMYSYSGLEGVNGYTLSTSPPDSSYMKPRSGFHFKKDYPSESHILVQYYDNTLNQSRVYDSKSTIPTTSGTFESSVVHSDAAYQSTVISQYGHKAEFVSGATTGEWSDLPPSTATTAEWMSYSVDQLTTYDTRRSRFSRAPQGNVLYCNSTESQIWGGDEQAIGALFTSASSVTEYLTDAKNYTNQLRNSLTSTSESATLTGTWLVGATRPLKGVKYYVGTAATGGGALSVSTWNGTSWQALSITDGTTGLTATGSVTFDSTVGTSRVKYLENRLLYWYQFSLSAGSAGVYYITVDEPWQDVLDIWDGTYREPITFQVYRDSDYQDYTLDVNTTSSKLAPIGAELGQMENYATSGEHVIIMFENKVRALSFQVLSGNTNGGVTGVTVFSWDGSAWSGVSPLYDSTAGESGATPLGRSGDISWEPPTSEFPRSLFGVEGYAYKVAWYGSLQGGGTSDVDGVIVDSVGGIPRQYKLDVYKFPATYKNRALLCGYLKGDQGNRIDYSLTNAPDVWNGEETSDDGRQSLYFGGNEELTAAVELFNRYGSTLQSALVVFKENEMYLLTGSGPTAPDAFNIDTVSTNLGCPAPLTVTVVEMGYEMIADEVQRNVVMFLSSSGPYLFDGSFPRPVLGIDKFFNPSDAEYLGAANIADAFAWYDSANRHWNLRVADKWFVYDMVRQRWFEKDTGSAQKVQCAFPVVDATGNRYIYGGLDTGYLARLEYGSTWAGTNITNTAEFGDFAPSNDPWHQTTMRRVKFHFKNIPGGGSATVSYASGTTSTLTPIGTIDMAGANRTGRKTLTVPTPQAEEASFAHRFAISYTGDEDKGLQLFGYGFQYSIDREDE